MVTILSSVSHCLVIFTSPQSSYLVSKHPRGGNERNFFCVLEVFVYAIHRKDSSWGGDQASTISKQIASFNTNSPGRRGQPVPNQRGLRVNYDIWFGKEQMTFCSSYIRNLLIPVLLISPSSSCFLVLYFIFFCTY